MTPLAAGPWLVTETAYGKVIGRRRHVTRDEAEATARTWRSQSAGVVTMKRCEAEA